MTRSFVAPSGQRRDPFTSESVKRGKRPKNNYEYDTLISTDDISKELKFIRKICNDALAIEGRVSADAFLIAQQRSIALDVFDLAYAKKSLGLWCDIDGIVSLYHEIHDRDNIDLRSLVQHLQLGVEHAFGYELGQRPLEAYQELLRHCGIIFLFISALEISERSPGFFDQQRSAHP